MRTLLGGRCEAVAFKEIFRLSVTKVKIAANGDTMGKSVDGQWLRVKQNLGERYKSRDEL